MGSVQTVFVLADVSAIVVAVIAAAGALLGVIVGGTLDWFFDKPRTKACARAGARLVQGDLAVSPEEVVSLGEASDGRLAADGAVVAVVVVAKQPAVECGGAFG